MTPDLETITAEPAGRYRGDVVMVHGAWHGAWCWNLGFLDRVAAAGFRATAVSLRGHAGSAGRERLRWTGSSRYVDDVAAVVDGLAEAPYLIGHSMGGYVVQRYLEEHSVPGAALLAPAPVNGVLAATLRAARRHPWAVVKANLVADLWPLVATRELAVEHLLSDDLHPAKVDAVVSRLQSESYRAYLDMIVRPPRPARVSSPVLVVGAARDRIFTTVEMRRTARAYGTDVVLVDSAHDLMLDRAWERVAETVLDWFGSLG